VSDKKVILLANSGHGFVMTDTANEAGMELIGYAQLHEATNNPFGLPYLGSETAENFVGWSNQAEYIIGIGDNTVREKIFNLMTSNSKTVRTLIHPSASISKKATIGAGVFISSHVSVNVFATIGDNVILNTAAVIEHECSIGNSVHIGPGVVLAGNVKVGERTFIGANATVKQGVSIGADVIIGAGAVIITDIPDRVTVVGNPGKIIK
jgi:acetyltransferase EpsM